jgi:hypothetical protein
MPRGLSACRGKGILCNVAEQSAQTREWLGRVRPSQQEAHERFVAWLNSEEARSLIARFPLAEYRLEQRSDELKVTLTATEPTGLIRFLRFDRFWPEFWEYQGGGRPAGPLPSPESLGPALRVYWRRGAGGISD